MTGTITLTAAMRANLLSLQQTSAQMGTTQLALSTGNKVNSALDSPVNFFGAQALNLRASSLSSLLDGMGQAVSTIQSANQGITSITGLVNQLTSIVNSATQDLHNQTTQNILATAGASGISSAVVANLVTANATVGDTLDINSANGAQMNVTVTAGESLNSFVAQINTSTAFTASIIYGNGTQTSPNGGGVMAVGSAYLQITANDGSTVTAANDAHNTGTAPGLIGELGLPAASTPVSTGGAVADNVNYQNVLAQINALAANANYQSSNLIDGVGNNMVVQVNELSTTPITVNSVASTVAGLGLTGTTVTTIASITAATSAIQSALTTLKAQASGFANSLSMIQNRQDFTTNLVNTLQSGATQLTIADKNEEGASMLALQTQQQLGIEALSLSSQANQSVLRLFA